MGLFIVCWAPFMIYCIICVRNPLYCLENETARNTVVVALVLFMPTVSWIQSCTRQDSVASMCHYAWCWDASRKMSVMLLWKVWIRCKQVCYLQFRNGGGAMSTLLLFESWANFAETDHWGRVTHNCVGKLTIIGSDNGLSPDKPLSEPVLGYIVNWILENKLQWNINRNLYVFIHENAFENVVRKLGDIFVSASMC